MSIVSCELLSDFVYSFFEHNALFFAVRGGDVVNCFQILYIRSLNTMSLITTPCPPLLWIAFRFCIFVLWTQSEHGQRVDRFCCELLSDFVYSFFEHNRRRSFRSSIPLWIAFRFCIFVLWTQFEVEVPIVFSRCELLSDFVYSFFEHNMI